MTPQQTIAFTHPCHLAAQTVHPMYGTRSGAWSLVLTINTGYE